MKSTALWIEKNSSLLNFLHTDNVANSTTYLGTITVSAVNNATINTENAGLDFCQFSTNIGTLDNVAACIIYSPLSIIAMIPLII